MQRNGNTRRRVLSDQCVTPVGICWCWSAFVFLFLFFFSAFVWSWNVWEVTYCYLVTVAVGLHVLVQCELALKLSNYLAMILRILDAKFFFNLVWHSFLSRLTTSFWRIKVATHSSSALIPTQASSTPGPPSTVSKRFLLNRGPVSGQLRVSPTWSAGPTQHRCDSSSMSS